MESTDAEEAWCIAGMHHVILHTIGRKSGNEHKVALPYWVDRDGNRIVVASFSGAPDHPSWYLNLSDRDANPEVKIRVQQGVFWADAQVLDGADYAETWAGAQRRPTVVRRLPEPHRSADPAGAPDRAPPRLTRAHGTSWTSRGSSSRRSTATPTRSRTGTAGTTSSTCRRTSRCPGSCPGKRYVAPPALHDGAASPPTGSRASPTAGVCTSPSTRCTALPSQVLADMTSHRDMLEDAGRMFAPEKKIVRAGDAMTLVVGRRRSRAEGRRHRRPAHPAHRDPRGHAARR